MSSLLESVITEIDQTMSRETVAPVKIGRKQKIVLDENGQLIVKRVRAKGVAKEKHAKNVDGAPKEKRVRVKKCVAAKSDLL